MNKWNRCYCCVLLLSPLSVWATVSIDWPHCTDSSCTHASSRPNCFIAFLSHKTKLIYVLLGMRNGILFLLHLHRSHSTMAFHRAISLLLSITRAATGNQRRRRQWVIVMIWAIFAISFVIGETFAFFFEFSGSRCIHDPADTHEPPRSGSAILVRAFATVISLVLFYGNGSPKTKRANETVRTAQTHKIINSEPVLIGSEMRSTMDGPSNSG